eukprot:11093307-Lingulodinium_polyedra.AAC.1
MQASPAAAGVWRCHAPARSGLAGAEVAAAVAGFARDYSGGYDGSGRAFGPLQGLGSVRPGARDRSAVAGCVVQGRP